MKMYFFQLWIFRVSVGWKSDRLFKKWSARFRSLVRESFILLKVNFNCDVNGMFKWIRDRLSLTCLFFKCTENVVHFHLLLRICTYYIIVNFFKLFIWTEGKSYHVARACGVLKVENFSKRKNAVFGLPFHPLRWCFFE